MKITNSLLFLFSLPIFTVAISSSNKEAPRVGAINGKTLGLPQGQYIESNGQLYQIVQVPAEETEARYVGIGDVSALRNRRNHQKKIK